MAPSCPQRCCASPHKGAYTNLSLPSAGVATLLRTSPHKGPYSNFFSLPCVRGGGGFAAGGVVKRNNPSDSAYAEPCSRRCCASPHKGAFLLMFPRIPTRRSFTLSLLIRKPFLLRLPCVRGGGTAGSCVGGVVKKNNPPGSTQWSRPPLHKGDGNAKPPLCKGRCRGKAAAEGLCSNEKEDTYVSSFCIFIKQSALPRLPWQTGFSPKSRR